jgi:cytochrome c oxidase assembly protein subunit 15
VWLFAVAFVILAMVIVGGATRATGSGLSITQWRPVSGVIPPLRDRDWEQLFALYKATPQYRVVNQGMSLAAFKTIFWWEWGHRLLGRILGVVFLVPFLGLLATRRLPRRLIGRCLVLFTLGGLQGLVGWWMVQSGLEFRTSVAPERLAIHLGLALLLYSAAIWTALDAWAGPPRSPPVGPSIWPGAAFLAAIYLQCLLGALVAGNHAGLANADWPMMSGRFVPSDYWQGGLWSTFAHGLAATQFDHRIWAYAVLIAGIVLVVRSPLRSDAPRFLAPAILACLFLQIALGVAALYFNVPLALALAHQFVAAVILGLATAFAWHARRYEPVLKYL